MAKKSGTTNGKKQTKDLHALVLNYVSQQKNATFNYKQVAYAIGADTAAAHRAIALILAEMAFDGDLIEVSPGKYKAPQRSNVTTGTATAKTA